MARMKFKYVCKLNRSKITKVFSYAFAGYPEIRMLVKDVPGFDEPVTVYLTDKDATDLFTNPKSKFDLYRKVSLFYIFPSE